MQYNLIYGNIDILLKNRRGECYIFQ